MSGKSAESLRCYEKVYHYDPSLSLNSLKLANTYAANGEKDKAKEVIDGYTKTSTYRQGDLDDLYSQYPELK